MKSTILGLMLWTGFALGQTAIDPTITGGTSAPAGSCADGELYFNSSAAAGQNLYVCVNNVWAQINGVAPGTALTGSSNTFASGTAQTFLGTLDASGASSTLPAEVGTTPPASCTAGQLFVETGSDPSRMLYVCSAANAWTQVAYIQGTNAQKPASCSVGQIYFATDAAAGSNLYFCTASNTWTQMTSPSVTQGTTAQKPASCSVGQIYFATDAAAGSNLYFCTASNTWTQMTSPSVTQGTTAQKPASCSVGQIYFATDAAAGSNLYFCTASNTWTQMAGCSSCLTGPGSSTNGYVPVWNGTTGAALSAGYAVAQTATANAIARLDSSGNINVGAVYTTGGANIGSATNWGYRIAGTVESVTCSGGTATLSGTYSHHRLNLNNQASCTITAPAASQGNGQLDWMLLCNGSTTATSTITWSGLKGGMAAGGSTNQCAMQTMYYDGTNSVWYATSTGSTWN